MYSYTEVDTTVPPETFSRQFTAPPLWESKRAVRTYTRMCKAPDGRLGFFDARTPALSKDIFELHGGRFIHHTLFSLCRLLGVPALHVRVCACLFVCVRVNECVVSRPTRGRVDAPAWPA